MNEPETNSAEIVTGTMVLGPLELVLSPFAALMLLLRMLLRCADVVGRYAFNAPVPGTAELTGLGLSLQTFATLPIITAYTERVIVGLPKLVGGRFNRYTKRIERVVLLATSLVATRA